MRYKKRRLLTVIFLLSLFATNAQRMDTLRATSQQQYMKYMQRRSTYKTAGWLLLGTGVVIFGSAYLSNHANGWNGPTKGEGAFTVGFAAAAVSPVFFILAGVNKRKANLVLKGERLTSAIMSEQLCYPAISLRLTLR